MWDHDSLGPHGGRQMILPATRTWRNRLVALSVPSTRLRSLQGHPQNLLSDVFKRDLQNTQTTPLVVVCTPMIKLVHRTTKNEKLVVCVKNSCSLFFVSPRSLPDSLFMSLSLFLGITEFCYAFLACVRTLFCFSETVYLQNQ